MLQQQQLHGKDSLLLLDRTPDFPLRAQASGSFPYTRFAPQSTCGLWGPDTELQQWLPEHLLRQSHA